MSRGRDYLQDPRKQGKLRDLQTHQNDQRKADLIWVMQAPQGRRFVHEMIFNACELMAIYPGQDSGIYRAEGRREVGFKLAREIQDLIPNEWTLMLAERQEEVKEYKRLFDAALTNAHGENDDG